MTTPEAAHHADVAEEHFEVAHDHHVCSTKTFVAILISLLFLTFMTVLVSRFHFGAANLWIAMGIAAIKAMLVITVFMHMLWDTTINKLFFLCSFLFLGILFLFEFADVTARGAMEIRNARPAPLNYKDMSEQSAPHSREERFHSQFDKAKEEK